MSSGVGARMQSLQVRFTSRAERLDITGLCVVRDANSETRRLRPVRVEHVHHHLSDLSKCIAREISKSETHLARLPVELSDIAQRSAGRRAAAPRSDAVPLFKQRGER
jgi:hypothetical protein